MRIFFDSIPEAHSKNAGNHKVSIEEYCSMATFFAECLLSPEETKKLKLNLSFVLDADSVGHKGYTMHEDDWSYLIWIRPSMATHEQMMTFAHEFVHVKQFIRKELCPTTGKTLTKSLQKLNPSNSDDYWDHPCEIEAYGRSFGLVHRYSRKAMTK